MKRAEAESLARQIQREMPEIAAQVQGTTSHGETVCWLLLARLYRHAHGFTSFELHEVRSKEGWLILRTEILTHEQGEQGDRARIAAQVRSREEPLPIPIFADPTQDGPRCPVEGCGQALTQVNTSAGRRYVCPRAIGELSNGRNLAPGAIHSRVEYFRVVNGSPVHAGAARGTSTMRESEVLRV